MHKIQLLRCSQDTHSQKKHTTEQGCEILPAGSLVKGRANIRIKSILGVWFVLGLFLVFCFYFFFFFTIFLYLFLGIIECLAKVHSDLTECTGRRNTIKKAMCLQRTCILCEKNHTVIWHEILQHGLTQNWSAQYCSSLGLETEGKLSEDYFREQKYGRKSIL